MQKNNIFNKNPLFQECPGCGDSNMLRKSHPRGWNEALIDSLTFYKVYRCRKCGWRGYLSTFNASAITVKAIIFYVLMVVLAAYAVILVLSKLAK
jgi:predicted RNA-binding Zn-ribbon protein involved in translation (DUF1610 family)